MLLPLLSANDPTTNSEGTLDPLGLYLIADALGIKLIPGIRERMTHPRFLTLTAVSPAWRREVMPILHRLISRHEPGGGLRWTLWTVWSARHWQMSANGFAMNTQLTRYEPLRPSFVVKLLYDVYSFHL